MGDAAALGTHSALQGGEDVTQTENFLLQLRNLGGSPQGSLPAQNRIRHCAAPSSISGGGVGEFLSFFSPIRRVKTKDLS